MTNENFKILRERTGIGYADIARRFNITRQHASQIRRNTSFVYKAAMYGMAEIILTEQIESLENLICDLKSLKQELAKEVIGEGNGLCLDLTE